MLTPHIHVSTRTPSTARAATGSGSSSHERMLLALDFDGVLGDTAGESAVAALRCLERGRFAPGLLEELERHVDADIAMTSVEPGGGTGKAATSKQNAKDEGVRAWLVEEVRRARPAVTTGYENLLMMVVLARGLQLGLRGIAEFDMSGRVNATVGDDGEKVFSAALPSDGADMMQRWGAESTEEVEDGLCAMALDGKGITAGRLNGSASGGEAEPLEVNESFFNCGMSRTELVALFGEMRDEMIVEDEEAWVKANRLYDGVADALKAAFADDHGAVDVWIVTTKQERFARLLLSRLGGVEVPPGRCVSLTESGRAKADVLREIQEGITPMEVLDDGADAAPTQSPPPKYSRKVFVEDRLGALERAARESVLDDWQLLLVEYGYNTEDERRRCIDGGRCEVVGIEDVISLIAP